MDTGKDNELSSQPTEKDNELNATSKQNRIINSVANRGLIPAAQLKEGGEEFFPSDDEFPRDYIAGIRLYPITPENRALAEPYFQRRLYEDAESVIPVVLERPGEKRSHYDSIKAVSDDEIKQECERRAASTFLVVCKKDTTTIATTIASPSQIPSKEFDYVLFPKTVYENYTQDPSAIPFPSNVSIQVIDDTVKRFIPNGIDMELEVPNYEQALRNILSSGVKAIFVHGVRLPLDSEKILFKKDPSIERQ